MAKKIVAVAADGSGTAPKKLDVTKPSADATTPVQPKAPAQSGTAASDAAALKKAWDTGSAKDITPVAMGGYKDLNQKPDAEITPVKPAYETQTNASKPQQTASAATGAAKGTLQQVGVDETGAATGNVGQPSNQKQPANGTNTGGNSIAAGKFTPVAVGDTGASTDTPAQNTLPNTPVQDPPSDEPTQDVQAGGGQTSHYVSEADSENLTAEQMVLLLQAKDAYAKAQAAGDRAGMDAAHQWAEQIRAQAGYSGGVSGSDYVAISPNTPVTEPAGGNAPAAPVEQPAVQPPGQTGAQESGQTNTQNTATQAPIVTEIVPGVTAGVVDTPVMPEAPVFDASGMKQLLSAWQSAANQQAQNQVDYATNQAIEELRRAEQDAQAQFKEQAESVAIDERQGMDNSALYAEARGDKGGIGQAQYNQIQAAAAQNRLAVQQAQTKLSTDTVRQIADLRAQGEFEKADAMLETAQTYLSQLVQLEQWAAEYGLNAAQFQAAMSQWQAEYDMAMAQYQTSVDQWNKEFQYQQNQDAVANQQWQTSFEESVRQFNEEMSASQSAKALAEQASMGEALLDAGVMPSAEQLAAMGITEAQAQQWMTAAQLEAAAKQNSSGTGFDSLNDMYEALKAANVTTAEGAKAQLAAWGVTSPTNYTDGYMQWYKDHKDDGKALGNYDYILSTLKSTQGTIPAESAEGMIDNAYLNGELTDAEYQELYEYVKTHRWLNH